MNLVTKRPYPENVIFRPQSITTFRVSPKCTWCGKDGVIQIAFRPKQIHRLETPIYNYIHDHDVYTLLYERVCYCGEANCKMLLQREVTSYSIQVELHNYNYTTGIKELYLCATELPTEVINVIIEYM